MKHFFSPRMLRAIIVIAYNVTTGGWESCGPSGVEGGGGSCGGGGSDSAPKNGYFFGSCSCCK